MTKTNVMRPLARANAFVVASIMALSALVPAVLLSSQASGSPLDNRFIDMSATQTSDGSGRDGQDSFGQNVTYSVSFDLGSDHTNLEGVVIQFCTDSPVVGDSCTQSNTDGFDLSTPTLSTFTGDLDVTGWTVGGDTDTLIISDATGVAGTTGQTVGFDIDGITNPDSVGTFYARILTYTDSTVATAYVPGTPGAYTDDGGIALAVTNELTISARVQEVLEFCIGTETDSAGALGVYDSTDECADVSGTALSLDVVDSSGIATTENIDTPNNGLMMIRTNAINGAVMYYKAEQNNSSGQLKIAGQACSGTDLDDPCFNSVGTTRTPIVAGVEDFGLALKNRLTTTGGATNAVTCDGDYRGDGTAGCTGIVAGDNYAWDDSGAFDTLASSSGPVDDEILELEFAATASPTTPTGLYTVTANFVATATF